ncbi:AAA family ATPase [Liquorilactobacillus hordei]|uniref:Uncharacterized protein n=1 Tax=Liquorilactobacillus hordei DSM 19519 TaxID=1423759 RepID=A0A0R1MUN9_9LACO|nr:AAA family ATPase [Liquorilactobacillus hordei]KRL08027.1 hypothetical protein FC92_GL001100 [Liquorilactobacillus hordei DSM 19519]QYH51029.1 AAA family ATPase [Liquorilactobacillus hordei DSM 19519]
MVVGRKPNSRKKGLKVLVYGDTGSGKSLFGLSFPKIKVLDSEDGLGWYENDEEGKNILEIFDTQSFYDLEDVLEELKEDSNFGTFIVDSETKIHEDVQQALLDIDEKRAKQKGQNVLDANVSIRSYGKIKQIETKLQNSKIELASRGVNIVSIAQSVDIMEEVSANKRVKVGEAPNMKKKADYDYDVVIRLFVKDQKFYGEIEKDRTKVTSVGEVVENPSYNIWKSKIENKKNQGEIVNKNFVADSMKSKERYEEELDEMGLTDKEKLTKFVNSLEKASDKKDFAGLLTSELGIKTLSKASEEQLIKSLEMAEKFKKDRGL